MRILFSAIILATALAGAQDLDLYGQVRTTGGTRLPNAQVQLEARGDQTLANASGTWTLSNLPKPSSSSMTSSSSSSSSSSQTTSTLAQPLRGYAVHFSPADGQLLLTLSEPTPVKIEVLNLQGKRTLLFANQVSMGQHLLRPFQHSSLSHNSGVVILRVQVGSQTATYQVNHLRDQVLGVQFVENRLAPVNTTAQASTPFVALQAVTAQAVDTLVFSANGFSPFKLAVLNYLQGALGNVYLSPIAPYSSSSARAFASFSTMIIMALPTTWLATR